MFGILVLSNEVPRWAAILIDFSGLAEGEASLSSTTSKQESTRSTGGEIDSDIKQRIYQSSANGTRAADFRCRNRHN